MRDNPFKKPIDEKPGVLMHLVDAFVFIPTSPFLSYTPEFFESQAKVVSNRGFFIADRGQKTKKTTTENYVNDVNIYI